MLFLRLVPWCSGHYHNIVSDPFTFNLPTHTDTQFTPVRPWLCFGKNQFVVSSIYQVSPHHNGVDGVVNDDNPRGRIPDTAPTEPCCDLPTLLIAHGAVTSVLTNLTPLVLMLVLRQSIFSSFSFLRLFIFNQCCLLAEQ